MSAPGEFLTNEWTETMTVVWPLGEGRSRARAARIMLGHYGVRIGPDDGAVPAAELLRFCRSLTPTAHLRQHQSFPNRCPIHDEDWEDCPCEQSEQECGCEDEGWFCEGADGQTVYVGWQTDFNPDDLQAAFIDPHEGSETQ